ncbi:hypothetical protein GCM10022276_06380 [Sphingomonas limnosediminicola]|uniref:DUF6894 domain-containing protein n=1 Tax=Sphingomonas limnosediminicola TaxID=940133 RepID=A0ABP7L162_9SPHN
MARYFFNFVDNNGAAADLVGRDLPDDEVAKSEARKLAADLGTDHAIRGSIPAEAWIEVIDQAQRPVARLPVARAIKEPNRIT